MGFIGRCYKTSFLKRLLILGLKQVPWKYRNSVLVACKYWTCNGLAFTCNIILAEYLLYLSVHYMLATTVGAFAQATVAAKLNGPWTFKKPELNFWSMSFWGFVVDMVGLVGTLGILWVEIEVLSMNYLPARVLSVVILGYPLYLLDVWLTYKISHPLFAKVRLVFLKARTFIR